MKKTQNTNICCREDVSVPTCLYPTLYSLQLCCDNGDFRTY